MDEALFHGELVRLAALDLEADADLLARWSADSEYMRLLDDDPPRPATAKKLREQLEKWWGDDPHVYAFAVRTLADDRLIGFVALDGVQWTHGDAFMAIGLGDREYWGQGYGTDATRIVQRYAFTELNLHRLSLSVFEYNRRALRSYEKAGFVVEGRVRRCLNRDGRRWDLIFMGILNEEWRRIRTGGPAP